MLILQLVFFEYILAHSYVHRCQKWLWLVLSNGPVNACVQQAMTFASVLMGAFTPSRKSLQIGAVSAKRSTVLDLYVLLKYVSVPIQAIKFFRQKSALRLKMHWVRPHALFELSAYNCVCTIRSSCKVHRRSNLYHAATILYMSWSLSSIAILSIDFHYIERAPGYFTLLASFWFQFYYGRKTRWVCFHGRRRSRTFKMKF